MVNIPTTGIVMLDFYADWCGPCKTMKPIIQQLKEENPDVHIEEINYDQNQDLGNTYNVDGLPTFIFLKDGKEKEKKVGGCPKNVINEILSRLRK